MTTSPGHSQSPIDFRRSTITFVEHLPRIEFRYPELTDVTLVNIGSPGESATVRADVRPTAASLVLQDLRYDLQQFHWHTPAEHEIEGRKSALEMHLVHRAETGAMLVIGVFIDQGRANTALDPIFRQLPRFTGETRIVPEVHLAGLLPKERQSMRYSGSLTTPPFTEGVQFVVFTKAINLSIRQIGAFRELFKNGNSREVQPLGYREVLSDAVEFPP